MTDQLLPLTSDGPVNADFTTFAAKRTHEGPSSPGVAAGPSDHNVAPLGGECATPGRPGTSASTLTSLVGQLALRVEPEGTGSAGQRESVVAAPLATPALVFSVWGTPIPQGSHKAFVVKGRPVITQDNKRTRPWRQDMTQAALEALGDRPAMTGPVEVRVQFVMPRPKGHYGTGRNADRLRDGAPTYPAGKPDVDKLARNLLDSLTAAAVVRDDAQVIHLCAHKVYADSGQKPGAHVYVTAATS